MGGGARRDQPVDVRRGRRPQAGVTAVGRLGDRVDRLAGAILARLGEPVAHDLPERGDGSGLADDHPRRSVRGNLREGLAPVARRHEVRADVTERR